MHPSTRWKQLGGWRCRMKVELAEYLWTPQRTGPRARSANDQIYSFRKRKKIHRERHTLYKKSFIRSKETFANSGWSPLANINISSGIELPRTKSGMRKKIPIKCSWTVPNTWVLWVLFRGKMYGMSSLIIEANTREADIGSISILNYDTHTRDHTPVSSPPIAIVYTKMSMQQWKLSTRNSGAYINSVSNYHCRHWYHGTGARIYRYDRTGGWFSTRTHT